MQTDDLEMKKLVYLYLINYSKSEPDLALLAVNTFVKDTANLNPLVRALALRTMGCIRVDSITEHLCEPLRRGLKDPDPYVRKTAVLGVAKMYDISPDLVVDEGFIDMLKTLLGDANPMVVSNSVATLMEIQAVNPGQEIFVIRQEELNKLLAALNACSEWGQVFILDALATYHPADADEAERIAERVVPRLNHANSAVVLSSVKLLLLLLNYMTNPDSVTMYCRKMAPPLVTQLSAQPEIRYVALRNINLVIQKRPGLLQSEIKVFFCKYNDPLYVKMEKLEIMMLLVEDPNIAQVLAELKEYATEVDVEFVRKAVRAIGRCAIKLDNAADQCVDALVNLIDNSQVNYVVQESIVVIRDIFRKYPHKYEGIIVKLCDKLESLDEPEAKAAMIWILGEYSDRIENPDQIFETYFVENFHDETPAVQLQILTAVVKMFLKVQHDTQPLVHKVLKMATQKSDNPDLRDRGFVYWRLLSASLDTAREVVLAPRPPITAPTTTIAPELLDELIPQMATLASVFHRPPETFITNAKLAVPKAQPGMAAPQMELTSGADEPIEGATSGSGDDAARREAVAAAAQAVAEGDLLPGLASLAAPAPATAAQAAGLVMPTPAPVAPAPVAAPAAAAVPVTAEGALPERRPTTVLLAQRTAKGFQLTGDFVLRGGVLGLDMLAENLSTEVIPPEFEFQFNKNGFGVVPSTMTLPTALTPGKSVSVFVRCDLQPGHQAPWDGADPRTLCTVPMALSNAFTGVHFFNGTVSLLCVTTPGASIERPAFAERFQALGEQAEQTRILERVYPLETCLGLLKARNLFEVARKRVEDLVIVYLYGTTRVFESEFFVEAAFRPTPAGTLACKVSVRSKPEGIATLAADSAAILLSMQ
eukprot:GAFH01000798.1.p2 GENE.GAFH01000798.1~~GAFH01000798.1.p2  ORF type:complete len:944 (-),score=481.64 GAFH01000798.1:68-2701(-)